MDYRNGGSCTPEALFSTRHGVAERLQLLGLGLTARAIDRRVAGGTWTPVHRGVYRLTACTTVARTIADLGGVLDEATLEQVLDPALRDGKTSVR